MWISDCLQLDEAVFYGESQRQNTGAEVKYSYHNRYFDVYNM